MNTTFFVFNDENLNEIIFFLCMCLACKLIIIVFYSLFKIKQLYQGDCFHFQRLRVSHFVSIITLLNKKKANCSFLVEESCWLICSYTF